MRPASRLNARFLVVVRDFDIVRIVALPTKTDSVLIVDPNAVLLTPATVELLQAVSWRHRQLLEIAYPVQLIQLPTGNRPHSLGARPACR